MVKGKKKQQSKLCVLVIAATKGGVGKTTLASILSVRAVADGNKVALLDVEPQASLSRWHELRGNPKNPRLLEVDGARESIGHVAAQGWDWVIVDTPPAMLDLVDQAISMADFVLVPTRPTGMDVEAVAQVVKFCKEHGKPFA